MNSYQKLKVRIQKLESEKPVMVYTDLIAPLLSSGLRRGDTLMGNEECLSMSRRGWHGYDTPKIGDLIKTKDGWREIQEIQLGQVVKSLYD